MIIFSIRIQTKSSHKTVNLNSLNSEDNYFYSFVLKVVFGIFFWLKKLQVFIYPATSTFSTVIHPSDFYSDKWSMTLA